MLGFSRQGCHKTASARSPDLSLIENIWDNLGRRFGHPTSLNELVARFKKTNTIENKQRSGRPRIFNEREERWIVRQVHINPRTSALKMTLQCKSRFVKSVNSETVRNVLRKHKYHSRVPQGKPYISKANTEASSLAEIVEVEIEVVSPSIPLVSLSLNRTNGAQGQRQAYLLPMPR
ncbi:transposable element Tc1 transposase [Trichonephila clavipes]|nr:transposable element Tc1 transposase [Trichonephila clavipes]